MMCSIKVIGAMFDICTIAPLLGFIVSWKYVFNQKLAI